MRIGLFGGSFNPIHVAHLILARDVLEALGLDRLEFVVAAMPPHKLGRLDDFAPAEDRLRMVEAAIVGHPRFHASGVELERPGPSYSIDTVDWYHRRFPGADLFWIVGADNLPDLHRWKDADMLVRRCRIVVVQRPGCEQIDLQPEALQLPVEICRQIAGDMLTTRMLDIDSTGIRARLRADRDISWLVPEVVRDHILRCRLYRA